MCNVDLLLPFPVTVQCAEMGNGVSGGNVLCNRRELIHHLCVYECALADAEILAKEKEN